MVLTPGPDMMFAMAQGLRGGAWAAIAAAAGVATGAFINATLAGLGLEAVVSKAPWIFGVVRWVGVGYLLYLAYKTVTTPLAGENARPVRTSHAFRDGVIVNVSNPSVIFFILAFIPQFVDPMKPILAQFLIYGGTIAVLGFLVKSGVGISAGERGLRWISATIFGALALRMAIAGGRS